MTPDHRKPHWDGSWGDLLLTWAMLLVGLGMFVIGCLAAR